MQRFVLPFLVATACSERAPAPAPSLPLPGEAGVAAVPADAAPRALDPAVIAKHWPDGCFAVRDATGQTLVSDAARCAKPRRPYSTFKLANALIAVDAGILAGPDAPLTWNKQAIPDDPDFLDAWRLPHTLKSGIAVSAVPYFRTLALQIGEARMRAGLEKLRYGNADLGGGLDRFWLRGKLRISATEQLAFVDGLARGTLPVSAAAQQAVQAISLLATMDDGTELHGKTGSGGTEDASPRRWLVWQVGWVKRGAEIVPYAAWMERDAAETWDTARAARDQRLRATLTELGLFTWPDARP